MLLFLLLVASLPLFAANPLTQAVRDSYQTMRLYLTASADMMPDEHYSFKLTPVSRTFGDWMKHTAEMNYAVCAKLRGVPAPDLASLSKAQTKADLARELKGSFSFCDPAFKGINDTTLVQEQSHAGQAFFPVIEMIGFTNSLHEHYGNLIGYLRSKGVTPPSTLRTQRVLQ